MDYKIYSKKIIYSDDENIFYKNRIILPVYSVRKSFILFEKIISSILKKKIITNIYSLISLIFYL